MLILVFTSTMVWSFLYWTVLRPLQHTLRSIEVDGYFSRTADVSSTRIEPGLFEIAGRFDALITKFKANEQVLKDSEERLRLALATTKQGLYDLNVQTGEVIVNPEYAKMLGYPFENFREIAETWRERLHPDDRQVVGQIYRDYVAGLRPDYRAEFRLRTSSAGYIWIYSVGAIVSYDAEGKPLRMLGTHLNITDRKQAELRQRESEQNISFAMEAANIGVWDMDLRTNAVNHSLHYDRCFGYTEPIAQWDYKTFLAHIHELDRERVDHACMKALGGKGDYDVEFRTVWPDGSTHWLMSKGRFYFNEDSKPYRVAGIQMDATNRKLAQQAIQDSESRYKLLFENSMDGIFQMTTDGIIVAVNAAGCAMFQLSEKQICDLPPYGLVDASDERVSKLTAEREATGRTKGEVRMIRGDGSRIEAEITSSVFSDSSGKKFTSVTVKDITERKQAEADINQLAFYDHLTNLPNRRLLMNRLEQALPNARRSGFISALLFIDLDNFKYVNDACGHAVGDALLIGVAQSLAPLLRSDDTFARIGGDEFVVLMATKMNEFDLAAHAAMVVADKIRSVLLQPIVIEGQQHVVSASIGLTLLPKYGQMPADVLREADIAMYRAKTAGRNQAAFFELKMQLDLEEWLATERDLALAITAGQLEMYMQPQVDMYGNPVSAELLMRWTHPDRGPISPAVFIPIAESSALILELGNWTLHQGCRAQVRLADAGRPLPLSINVSPRQFRQTDFVEQVREAVAKSGADPTKLIFEVTEGMLIENLDVTIARMLEIATLGIRFSIDDFGTGYSSLAYLKRLPLYELKIDKSFIQDTPSDPDDTAIVQSILSMAKHLRLRVVAEGVETHAQADFLLLAGCDVLQGYLYAKPMPIETWLVAQSTAREDKSVAA